MSGKEKETTQPGRDGELTGKPESDERQRQAKEKADGKGEGLEVTDGSDRGKDTVKEEMTWGGFGRRGPAPDRYVPRSDD